MLQKDQSLIKCCSSSLPGLFYFSLLTGLSVALDRKCCGLEINVLILIVEKVWKAGTLYLMNKMFISLLSINEMHGEMISSGEMVAT